MKGLPYDVPEDRGKLSKILELLKKYYLDNENVICERSKFYQRQQEEGEPVESFIPDLRSLAQTCEFSQDGNDFSEQMIRDRLVCGIRSDTVPQRLLAKGKPKLMISMCVKELRSVASTSEQVKQMQPKLEQRPSMV